MRMLYRICAPAVLLAAATQVCFSQTGQITGRVRDASDAVVPGVTITVTNQATGAARETKSNEVGYYTVPSLPAGAYRVSLQADGFKSASRVDLQLSVEQILRADFVLEVGSVSESVEVKGASPLLQTAEGSLGTVVGQRVLMEFPLNGRSFQDLVSLGAGVVPTTRATRIGLGDVSVNGARYQSNNYVLDGADNNSNIFNSQNNDPTAYAPPPDALSEFKVLTNSYSAEYGRGSGAAVSATIRSGTNEFHGSAYEFLRNDKLDARNFFAVQPAQLRRNQFGGTLGGPIVRNQSFFFFSYEGRKIRTPGSDAFANVPTLEARGGDLGAYKPIFDPTSGAPFAGNRIPASRFDPVSARLSKMWPEPNLSGIFRNYLYRTSSRDNRDKYDGRVDHTFSTRDSMFFRFSLQQQKNDTPRGIPLIVDGSNVNRDVQETNARSAAAGHTHVFGPSVVNEFRAAFHWTRSDVNWGTNDNIAAKFDVPGLPAPLLSTPGMPNYNVSGVNAIGGATFRPNLMREQTLQIKDSLFQVRGSHTIKIGGEFKTQHIPFSVAQNAMGQFSFTGGFTARGAGTGEGLGDFILGFPQNFQGQSRTSAANMRRFITAGYLNDDWKVTSRLTLNLGLRYEFFSPLVDTHNRFSSFQPVTGDFRIARDGGLEERALVKPDYRQFAPRIGLAYRLDDRTVVRSGYGLFYSGEEPLGAGFWLQNNPNYVVGVALFAVPPEPLLKLERGLPSNLFSLGGISAPTASGIQGDARVAYAQNWNLTLQRTFGGNWSAQASYVGSNGSHFLTPVLINQARPGAGSVQSRRPYPSYGTITFIEDRGKTNYHSLQTQVEKTFSKGLSLLGSYTYAKAIDDHEDMFGRIAAGNQYPLDPSNLALERGLSGTDIRHRVTYSMLYQLPFGRGRSILAQASKPVDLALGGWDVAAVTSFFSGSPFSVSMSQDACGCGLLTGQLRADRLRDGRLPAEKRSIDGWYDVSAFVPPARGTLGNSGRNILIGPGASIINLSVMKSFSIWEQKRLQFRAEFFNFPNHANFGLPGINIEAPGAGLIRGADAGRQIQLALRFQF
ncbi:MAG: TonB-dependent receptor [Acidobacteria bacterium]|nr:TonB-dependent receptor [Acidobacteriota bacterium]